MHPFPPDHISDASVYGVGPCYTDYVVLVGADMIFRPDRVLTLDEITDGDGTEETILAVEAAGTENIWTEPRDLNTRDVVWRINAPGNRPGYSRGVSSSYLRTC